MKKCLIILLLFLIRNIDGYQRISNRLILPISCASTSLLSSVSNYQYIGQTDIKICSFNILAPCYYKITNSDGTSAMEAEDKNRYMQRNIEICNALLETNADVINLQEFWCANDDIKKLYREKFCHSSSMYTLKEFPRSSYWRSRDDGLAVLVKESKVVLQDYRAISFHDCGDRVGQLMLLAIKPTDSNGNTLPDVPYQQLICVNTHLLFPHNENSSKIRLREVTKILGYIESYRQINLCTTICGRSDVRIPVVLCGDFNGSPNGQVYQYIKSQSYKSAIEHVLTSSESSSWISHRSHLKTNIAVDHIFYINPSNQEEDALKNVPVPNWMNLVFNELMEKIIKEYGTNSMKEIFSRFDQDKSTYITRDDFRQSLQQLGFIGEGKPSLTDDEIEILIDSADVNGDDTIDYKEFYDRFWQASNNEEQLFEAKQKQKSRSINLYAKSKWLASEDTSFISKYIEDARPLGNLEVKEFNIYPAELLNGVWPPTYNLSDHGMIMATFICSMLPREVEELIINPNPTAQKKLNEEET
jgi:endonuclease/exonuclease/phosphatase family metal-dependent hydrolase